LLLPTDRPPDPPEPASLASAPLAAAATTGQKRDGATPPPGVEPLPDPDPVAFLEKCLARYDREVRGYSATLRKQERVRGKLNPPEKIEVHFREQPFSVYMQWEQGRRLAERVLYVEGANDGKLLVRPAGLLALLSPVVTRSLDSPDVKDSGRFSITEFGLKKGMQGTLGDWKAARQRGALDVEYLGVRKVPEVGDRLCYQLRRTHYDRPEYDGIMDMLISIDREHWLQVGSVMRDEHDELIAEYFFSNVRLNPPFPPEQFERNALTPAP
jgi:hypothetical protein